METHSSLEPLFHLRQRLILALIQPKNEKARRESEEDEVADRDAQTDKEAHEMNQRDSFYH